ncbi:MAG: serine kinase [Methylobacterium sp.]|uniref:HPr kinase/phosphorylase n=1 Tax=Methylobacterium sp. TaxID=409 RepID=UPI0025FD514C|nr:serine kinase [Methylobacterium sp.]MBX9933370.1 serine kinase [Methylobacterium sp.]
MHVGETVHATCLVAGESGVLIRGEPGSGKTNLALALLDRALAAGLHAAWVGDDRIRVEARNGRVIARPHPEIAGLAEIRGHGIRRIALSLDAAVIRLVVDLGIGAPRLPDAPCRIVQILGIDLPQLSFDPRQVGEALALRVVLDALHTQAGCVAGRTHPPILAPWHATDP